MTALQGRRLLVVEDDFLMALSVGEALEHAGAEIVLAGALDEALGMVTAPGAAFDGAVLDVNLHDDRCYPVADALRRRGVEFVFTTGYGMDAIDPAYRDVPRYEKPVDLDALIAAMAGERGQAARACSSSGDHTRPVPEPGSTGAA